MGFDMEGDSISPEENNLLRLINVIKKPCTECLRHVLKINIPSHYTDVKHAVSSNQTMLQKKLKKDGYSKIFPQNKIRPDFDVYKCDASLLYTLIRNVSSVNPPTTTWGKPVNNQPRENSIGANVERLRKLRNDITHEDRHEVTDSEFNDFWINIEASLADIDQSLGNTHFKQDLLYLRTCSLENKFLQKEITKIRTRRKLQEIQEVLNELKVKTEKIGDAVCGKTEVENELKVMIEKIGDAVCGNTEVENELKVMIEKIGDAVCGNTEFLNKLKVTIEKIGDAVCGNTEQDGELNNRTTENRLQVCRNTGHCEVGNDPQNVAGCEGIQRLSLEALDNTDRINHQCMNDRESAEVDCDNSVNIQNLHNEADNKGAPNDAMNFDMSRDNDISIAEGPDGFIRLTKQYVCIKSNLLKKEAVEIAEHLLKAEHITKDEYETIADLKIKPCIDTLLKKIILEEDADQLKTFFRALRSVNQKVFIDTEATEVTDEDISRFKQVEKRAFQVPNARSRSDAETILDDSDILFFQNHLSQAVVDNINDTMLASFNFSVREHSNILECKQSDPKIRKLCETINLCDMDVENELKKTRLSDTLYKKWMEFRKQKENQDRRKWLQWLNAPVSLVRNIFPVLSFNKAVNGCIILKFSTGDGFDIASLTREFVRENVTDLLWKGNLETQMNIKNPINVTVFIMSPSENGNDEVHFYLDFDATDERTRGQDCGHEIANQERLLEQLDLIEVTEWIMSHPDMEETATKMLEDKLSSSDMSRKEELHILLDSIYEIKNGRELIERFCKENYPDEYKNLFLRTEQETSEKNTSMVEKTLQYERGRGLQRLYSFRIDINTDEKDIKMSPETEGLQRATLDERPSKEMPNQEVSDIKMSQETEGLQRATLDERPSKEMPNQEVSDSGVSPGYIHKLLPKIQKTNDDSLKPTVWKRNGFTYVLQVGKLEDVWSDAMVIFGQDPYSLPSTFVEKVGPQIQREFQDKYPNGLSEEEVAVLSGFNLYTWKVFYCCYSYSVKIKCFEMADKLKMKSILFLVQEEHLKEIIFINDYDHLQFSSISAIYFHVDQDTLEWRKLREIAEERLLVRRDFKKLSAGPEPKVFNVGHTTINIQFGKLDEIKSEAVVFFEVATGQWPTQNLPSEILEKAGPMIQREFKEKFPDGLKYAEVAVLNGHNLPFRKILYGVLPRWPGAWLKQVIAVFLTECFQLASDEGIKCIAYLIPSVTCHIAELCASVLHEMLIDVEPSLSISTENIVIKDGCTGANMLKAVFEEECASRRVFKEGHFTVVTGKRLLEKMLMRRGKAIQMSAKLSEGLQEKAIVPDSKALVIVSDEEYFTNVLEEIGPSLTAELGTKYPSALLEDKVTILDGYNDPFKKIYWRKYTTTVEITDIILECFQMAENDKMNSIILQIRPHWVYEKVNVEQELILGLRIFAIENPFSGIRRLYNDIWFFREKVFDVTSMKVFKERHVTVALNATFNEWEYTRGLHCSYLQRLGHELKSVHVICNATDEWEFSFHHHEYQRHLERYLPTQEKEMMHFLSEDVLVLEHFCCDTVRVIISTKKLNRQDMDMFFFKCMQEADDSGVSSVTFLVPETVRRSIELFASTLISCVKRFAKENPSSSIKRIYIRIDKLIAKYRNAKQIFEKEWARTSGGKQGYPSEDIYLKKKLSISVLPEKSKEGSKYVSQEDVD